LCSGVLVVYPSPQEHLNTRTRAHLPLPTVFLLILTEYP